jgi:tRNA-intron endonuclease
MPGELIGEAVVVGDQSEASQIYNKGYYGYPQSGGGVELDLLEAVYLQEAERLVILEQGKEIAHADLIKRAARASNDFEIRYIVYRDFRQRGYIVKSDAGEFDFRVFPRGGTPSTVQTKYWVKAVSERAIFDMRHMLELSEMSDRTRKELILGVVDEEGDLTYYRAASGAPTGREPRKVEAEEIEGFLLEDRVFVTDERGAELHTDGFYGKQIGRALHLSLIESAYLMHLGRLVIRAEGTGKRMSLTAFKKQAESVQPDFELRLRAYEDLRKRGLVVKTGFKYGSHFRVYDGDPDTHHSKYLVHAVQWNHRTIWPEMSRAVRLAHGVKKEILFAMISSKRVEYLRLRRVRP